MDSIVNFLKESTFKEWGFLFTGVFLGYLGNYIFYLKSKNDSHEKNIDRLFILYDKIINQPNYVQIIQEIKNEIGTKNNIENLEKELVEIKEKIAKSPTSIDVLKYKLLGDKWSDEYLKTIKPKILSPDGLLFYSNILNFHKSIFPPSFEWAGRTRISDIIISGSFGTMTPMSSQATVEYNIKPVRHQDVLEMIERYCNKWNANYKSLLTKNTEQKIEDIAMLHHEFQVIHPFIDGNGRVGRVILNDMIEYLLNKNLLADYNREEYYSALRFADLGDITPLKGFIVNQMTG